MADTTLQELEDRLTRIERQNRRLRWGVAALVVLVAAALSLGGWAIEMTQRLKAQSVLEARELLIVDGAGRTRARIGTSGGMTVALTVFGANGRVGTSLEVDANGRSHLRMGDKFLGWLDLKTEGGPKISLSGASGDTGLTMWVTRDGLPSFRLGNPQGSPRLEFNLLDREAMAELLAPRSVSDDDVVAPSGDQYYMHRGPRSQESQSTPQYTPHGWLLTGNQPPFDVLPAKPGPTSAVVEEPPKPIRAVPRTTLDTQRPSGEVVPPVAIGQREPVLSAIAKREGLQGIDILEIIVAEDGSVRDARVLKGLGRLVDAEVVAAVLKWRFKPAMLNGKPISVNLTVSVRIGGL